MAKINGLEKMTYAELVQLRSRVDAAIVERQATEKRDMARKLEAMASASGFTVRELFGARRGRPPLKSSAKGQRVAVKFRNPKDPSQTWTGRGRMSKWLAEALKRGQNIETFKV